MNSCLCCSSWCIGQYAKQAKWSLLVVSEVVGVICKNLYLHFGDTFPWCHPAIAIWQLGNVLPDPPDTTHTSKNIECLLIELLHRRTHIGGKKWNLIIYYCYSLIGYYWFEIYITLHYITLKAINTCDNLQWDAIPWVLAGNWNIEKKKNRKFPMLPYQFFECFPDDKKEKCAVQSYLFCAVQDVSASSTKLDWILTCNWSDGKGL